MPFGISSLNFIDDAFDSLGGALDGLFSNKEERQKARNEMARIKAKIKNDAREHTEKMAQIYTKGRMQARSVQQKSLEKAWWMMPTLAILAFVGFFGILFALVFGDINLNAKQPLLIMLGTLGTIVTQIAHFLWGSSQGSKEKDSQIKQMMASQPQQRTEEKVSASDLQTMSTGRGDSGFNKDAGAKKEGRKQKRVQPKPTGQIPGKPPGY